MKRKIAVCAALAIICYARNAPAEPLRLLSPATCTTEGGSALTLDPGRYLPEPVWESLDFEVKRLQTAETRLTAENGALRKSAAGSGGSWVLAGLAFSAGIAAGLYASR